MPRAAGEPRPALALAGRTPGQPGLPRRHACPPAPAGQQGHRAGAGRWHQLQPGQPGGQPPRCAASWTTTTPPPRPGRCAGPRSGCWRPPMPGCTRRPCAATAASTRTAATSAPSARWSSRAARLHLLHVGDRASTGCMRRRWSSSPKTTGCACRPPSPTWGGPWAPARTWRSTTAAGRPRWARSTCWPPTAPTTHLDAASVHAALQQHPDDLDAAARPWCTGLARGSDDNITCSWLRIDALPEPAAPSPAPGTPGPAAAAAPAHGVRGLHHRARAARQRPQPRLPGRRTKDRQAGGAEDPVGRAHARDTAYLDRFVLEEWVARRWTARTCSGPGPRAPAQHLYVAMEYVEGRPWRSG
jgi:hypothetical protein